MKTITALVVLWLCFCPMQAQKIIEKTISFTGKEAVTLKIQIADSISIQTWNKNEVYVKASVNVNDNEDNDAYLASFDDNGKSVIVNAKFKDNYSKGKNNCCYESIIYWQLFIPENTMFSVETINADITITGETRAMKVESISGFIDLSVPADKNADLNFSTVSGNMYSNLDFSPAKTRNGKPSKLSEKLNNGGDLINLETVSGDIYFRKASTR
ncbi:MAG TPA: DUF4097 family beta strand repeat-containing protein [Bacteroidales bacterium]|nr:DUF4097 family beta strand repeat-containing protein [Bacteroidales bacterium]